MSNDLKDQEQAEEPASQPYSSEPKPVRRCGTGWWTVWFFIALAIYWTPPFLFGLSPRRFGSFGLFLLAPFLSYVFSYILLIQVFLSVSRGRSTESGFARSRRGLAFRLVCFLAALTAMVMVHIVGTPMNVGRFCGAKWGMGLPALKRFQSSPEVAALAESGGGTLEVIPPYLHSSYWGPPQSVIVQSGSTGSPVIMLNWGGGFYSYGIVISDEGEFPLPADTYIGTPLGEEAWEFVAP